MLPFDPDREMVLVLGYDGSAGAHRALAHVAPVLRRQPGWVQVVHVVGGQEEVEAVPTLAEQVQLLLANTAADWRFESRRGILAEELISVAKTLASGSPHRSTSIVVGRPGSHHPDLDQSVLAELFRSSPYPVLMVP